MLNYTRTKKCYFNRFSYPSMNNLSIEMVKLCTQEIKNAGLFLRFYPEIDSLHD